MDRPLRRLGQLLVIMGAVLGAALGVSLALIVEHAETSRTVAGPGRERTAVLAASPQSSKPPPSQAASTQDPGDGNNPSASPRTQPADRANQHDGKADKNGEGHRDKPGRGKDKPGKSKGK